MPNGYDEVVGSIATTMESPSKKRKRKSKEYNPDLNELLNQAVNAEMSDAYNYSSAELYTQMAQAWNWYWRQPIGNEVDGFSTWVSPMISTHVNQVRAFITGQYFRNSAPIIRFRPKDSGDVEEAELATEYVNYIFRHKLPGFRIVDDLIFNAALLKWNPVRVTMCEERQKDEIEFKYTGRDVDEFEENLAHFYAANPEYIEQEPDYKKEMIEDEEGGELDICYRWITEEVIERYPKVDVISPGAFFVSRQAESEEDARMVAQMSKMTVSDLKTQFPDAPAINGWKKSEYDDFWETLVSDYLEWYTEIEWLSKWSKDSLGFVSQYTEGNDRSAGLGSKEVFVMDAEIYIDADDSGYSQLCHVIKVGNRILHKKYITDRSYMWSSFCPTANRHLGISFVDLLEQEATEETVNVRAFTDATVQAAHSNMVYDPDQIEDDDLENLGPDDMIRRRRNVGAKPGVAAVEVLKQPGPDPSVLQAVEMFKGLATQQTGVGANFQGATQDEVSDMRVSTETAKIIDNNSSLMLNYFARNFAEYLCKILVRILDVAVNHGASQQLVQIKDSWKEAIPGVTVKGRADFILNADIGVNDAQEKANKASSVMQMIQAASGGGGQDAQGNPIPTLPIQLTPSAGYEAAKLFLEAQGVDNIEMFVVNPNIPPDQTQQAAFTAMLQEMQQAIPQMVQQGVQQAVETANQEADNTLKLAQAAKTEKEIERMDDASEKEAFEVANKLDAEDRREDSDVQKAAAAVTQAEAADFKAREDIRLREEELALQKEIAAKTPAEGSKTTSVVSP